MKYQVPTIVKGAMFSLFLLATIGFSNHANAQIYGGNAYAWVKDDQGVRRTVNAVFEGNGYSTSEGEAKKALLQDIKSDMSYKEKLDSEVHYSIDKINKDDDNRYNGSASVKVENSKGETRYIEVNLGSTRYTTKTQAKFFLRNLIVKETKYNERTVSGISFSIRTAN